MVFLKVFARGIRGKPKSIRAESSNSFIIEVFNREQSNRMEELTEINKISVKVSKHQHYNTSQGILNIYDYNLSNFETFKTGLAE